MVNSTVEIIYQPGRPAEYKQAVFSLIWLNDTL